MKRGSIKLPLVDTTGVPTPFKTTNASTLAQTVF